MLMIDLQTVKDILNADGSWDMDKLSFYLPDCILDVLKNVPRSIIGRNEDDRLIWKFSPNGAIFSKIRL